jgi:hypothetical protein
VGGGGGGGRSPAAELGVSEMNPDNTQMLLQPEETPSSGVKNWH